jgi:hypothetical protein
VECVPGGELKMLGSRDKIRFQELNFSLVIDGAQQLERTFRVWDAGVGES